MKRYATSAELKRAAKDQLFGKLGTVIGAFIVHMLVYLPVIYASTYFPIDTPLWLALSFLLDIVISLYGGILAYGSDFLFLKVATGDDIAVTDLFYGFKNDTAKVLALKVIPIVITTVAQVPYFLMTKTMLALMPDMNSMMQMIYSGQIDEVEAMSEKLMPVMLLYLLVFFLYIIVLIVVNVLFSQTLFTALDYPNLGVKETFKKSFKLIKGNWGKYIYIMLSFIPWYVLGLFTFYTGLAWAIPYMRTTMANFYLDLVKNKSEEN